MAIISLHNDNPLMDGRQSPPALAIRRGLQRLLHSMYHSSLPELGLANGRRADLITITPKGEIWIIEIKSSIQDFRADHKWPDYRHYCDRLFFATHRQVPLDIFPDPFGLFLSDGYGAHMVREAPEHKLSSARRRSVILNFSRVAALRLMNAEWATASQGEQREI